MLLGILAILAGCAGPSPQTVVPADPSRLGPVRGDREDADRALRVALEVAQAAPLQSGWQGNTFTATLVFVENRQGQARAVDLGDGTFELWAYVEPRGDLATQETLLKAWARRLEQLRGVQWAPR